MTDVGVVAAALVFVGVFGLLIGLIAGYQIGRVIERGGWG